MGDSCRTVTLTHGQLLCRDGLRIFGCIEDALVFRRGDMTDDGKDEHTWLEEIEGDTALDWVKQRNADAIKALGDPTTTPAYERILGILDSKDKIPGISRISNDGYYYNFWRDDKHVAGIWRRGLFTRLPSPRVGPRFHFCGPGAEATLTLASNTAHRRVSGGLG